MRMQFQLKRIFKKCMFQAKNKKLLTPFVYEDNTEAAETAYE